METEIFLEHSTILSIIESCDRATGVNSDSRVSIDFTQIEELTEEGFLSELPPLQLKILELQQQQCN